MHALTQEELLVEAAETELVNTASLARLIAVEEEVWLSARLRNLGPDSAVALPLALSKKGCMVLGTRCMLLAVWYVSFAELLRVAAWRIVPLWQGCFDTNICISGLK